MFCGVCPSRFRIAFLPISLKMAPGKLAGFGNLWKCCRLCALLSVCGF